MPLILVPLVDRPIAFHRVFAEITGSAAGGVWLSQAVYWQPKATSEDGYWYKSRREWHEETALSRREQEAVREKLRSMGVLQETRRGVPCTVHYRLDLEALAQVISSWSEMTNWLDQGEPTGRSETPIQKGESSQHIPETPSETTPETSHSAGQGPASSAPAAKPSYPQDKTPAKAGGVEVTLEELEADPVLWSIVGNLVEATRHGDAPRDLRSVAVTEFKARNVRLHGPTLDAVVAAVTGRCTRKADT